MTERHAKVLNKAVNVLKSEKYSSVVKRIYLYGSCARGEEKYNSDVDLIVEVTRSLTHAELAKLRYDAENDDYTLPEVNIYTKQENQDVSLSRVFNQNFEKDKVLLWERI